MHRLDSLNSLIFGLNVYQDFKFKSWAVIFLLKSMKLLSEIWTVGCSPTILKCCDRLRHEINRESIKQIVVQLGPFLYISGHFYTSRSLGQKWTPILNCQPPPSKTFWMFWFGVVLLVLPTVDLLTRIIVQLGLDFKLNTKIGLDTTHPPQTFRPLPGLLGGWDLVCWLYSQIKDYPRYNKLHLSRQH